MKHPTDRNGEKLRRDMYYYGYRPGVYILFYWWRDGDNEMAVVKKIASGKGVAVQKPRYSNMSAKWLRRVEPENQVFWQNFPKVAKI